jgi:diacylglycerol kinase family enzyme
VRALLIVNPHATSTNRLRRDVIAHALASELDLEVVETRYRGHASDVAAGAAGKSGAELVLTLGGDGTVNEVVNGLLRAGPRQPGPALAALPGGNANVFSRALGLPPDLVDATGMVLASLASGKTRTIGVGLAGDRYFCFNAGLGFDGEVVRVVEGLRAHGRNASTGMYVRAAVRQFYGVTDRRRPALSLERPGQPTLNGLFCGFVSNTSPWSYLGRRPVLACPQAGFDTALDVLGLRSLGTLATVNALRQMLRTPGSGQARPLRGKHILSLHDQATFTITASRPVAFQVDGEYVGERECVTFRSVPDAIRVLA